MEDIPHYHKAISTQDNEKKNKQKTGECTQQNGIVHCRSQTKSTGLTQWNRMIITYTIHVHKTCKNYFFQYPIFM